MNYNYKIYKHIKKYIRPLLIILLIVSIFNFMTSNASAQSISIPKISIGVDSTNSGDQKEFVTSIQILLLLTVLALAPSILVMMTCFTRIIVVFYFLRNALGTATQPPNQLLTSFALFLTIFIMQPVFNEVNEKGLQPYLKEQISQTEAIDNMMQPMRNFMLKHKNSSKIIPKHFALKILYN